MKNWIRSLFRGKSRSKAGSRNSRAALISPSYDVLTSRLNALVRDLFDFERSLITMLDESASKKNIVAFLSADNSTSACIIFTGHGKETCLLTAPSLGLRAEEFEGEHSVLLDQSDLSLGRGLAVFAYACDAGFSMGPYAQSVGAFFIGYEGEVPFIPNDDDTGFDEIFYPPIGIAVENFEVRGTLDYDTFRLIKSYYDRALEDVRPKRRDYRYRAIGWALKLHRERISAKGGD